MSSHIFDLPDLVVPIGQTVSNVIYDYAAGIGFQDADSIQIFSPDVLAEIATVRVGNSNVVGAEGFSDLERGGSPVTVAADTGVTIELPTAKALQIKLDGAAAASRTFKVNKSVWI